MSFYREKKGLPPGDMIFGTRAVIEAILAGKEVEKILVQTGLNNDLIKELLLIAKNHGAPVMRVPVEKIERISRKNHQGVICFLSPITYSSLESIVDKVYADGKMPFLLILDRITDVRNFGAICRTALSSGINAVIIPEKGSAQINADAVKTSAGALLHLSICRVHSLIRTVQYLQDYGIKVVACSEKASKLVYDVDLGGPLALVMGSEEDGVSNELIRKTDELAKLPMFGEIASLNVSAATSAILYECVRQRLA
jgi:23S rRNA (guanosine2251-2'-O)-methyltransferase